MDYKKLTSLVSKNEFELVFETLSTGIPEKETDLLSELATINGNYQAFKKKDRLGIISNENSGIERNKIALSSLEFIDAVKKKLT